MLFAVRRELVKEPNKKCGISQREVGWESGKAASFHDVDS